MSSGRLPPTMDGDSIVYPYVKTLRSSNMIHRVVALNILCPVSQSTQSKGAYVIQTNKELILYKIEGSNDHELICSQPLYSQVIALQRIKWRVQDQQQDFLFMMTKDLKIHILHFNRSIKQLEIISSFAIDFTMGATGRSMREISYITFDSQTSTVLAAFSQNYVLTVNLKSGSLRNGNSDCECLNHIEISNYTLSDIESSKALSIKKVTLKDTTYLAILYDQKVLEFPQQQIQQEVNKNVDFAYNVKFHELTVRDDEISQSTILFDQVHTLDLQELQISEEFSHFYLLSFAKKSEELIIISSQGIFLLKPNLDQMSNSYKSLQNFRYLPLEHSDSQGQLIEHVKFYGQHERLLLFTGTSMVYDLNIRTKQLSHLSLDDQVPPSPYLIAKLREDVFLCLNEQSDHYFFTLANVENQQQQSLIIKPSKSIQNLGSLGQLRFISKDGGDFLVLQQGAKTNRLYRASMNLDVDIIQVIDFEDSNIEEVVSVGTVNDHEDWLLIKTTDGSWQMISLNGNSIPLDVGQQEDVTGVFNTPDKRLIAFNTSILIWDERQMQVIKVEDYMQQVAFIGSTGTNAVVVYLNMKNQLYTYSLGTERPSLLPIEKDKEIHSFAVATTGGGKFLAVSFWSDSTIYLYRYPETLSPLVKIPISNYSPSSSSQLFIDKLKFYRSANRSLWYLLVTLSDTSLAAFNFYPESLETLLQNNLSLETHLVTYNTIFHDIAEGQRDGNFLELSSDLGNGGEVVISNGKRLWCLTSQAHQLKVTPIKVSSVDGHFKQACCLRGQIILNEGNHLTVVKLSDQRRDSQLTVKEVRGQEFRVTRMDFIEEAGVLCLCTTDDSTGTSRLLLMDLETNNCLFNWGLPQNEQPTALKYHLFEEGQEIVIFLGTTEVPAQSKKSTPTSGRIYPISIRVKPDGGPLDFKVFSQLAVQGAVIDIDILVFSQPVIYLVLGVNSFVNVFLLQHQEVENHPLDSSQLACKMDQQVFVQRVKAVVNEDQLRYILVADIMKSLTIYRLQNGEAPEQGVRPILVCRDPRAQWCLDMIHIQGGTYLISDFKQNLVMLLHKDEGSIHFSKLLQVAGGMNLGEQANAIEVIRTKERGLLPLEAHRAEVFLSKDYTGGEGQMSRSYFDNYDLLTLCKRKSPKEAFITTSDGAILKAKFLLTREAYLILKGIQDALALTTKSFGEQYPTGRKDVKVLEDEPQAQVFLDGDFIETLLDKPLETQTSIINQAFLMMGGETLTKDHRLVRSLIEHLKQH